MGSAYRLFYDQPLHLVRGEGVWLYDADGRKYLDMYNNVPHVGHCHPRVVEAICRQAGVLNTHTRYLHDNVVDLADRLTAKLPTELDTAMFCCTGSEANELALRIAKKATDGAGFVVTSFSYHGNTQATYEVSTDSIPDAELPDHVVTVPAPDCYRGPHRGDGAADKYAAHVCDALDQLRRRGIRPAAFLIDTIVSSSGVVAPPPGYLGRVAEIVRDAGAVFIADEVQPGFGRTGNYFWGFEVDDFVPDIVTMGKPMGNGHPISSVVTRSDLADKFARHSGYFNTFGGNPVSCAAGLAVLDVIEEEQLQQNALTVGQHLAAGLWQLAERYDCIGDVRSSGLFIAVELVADRVERTPATEFATRLVNDLCQRGVLTGAIGPDANILKLRPPLVLTKNDADYMLGILDESLSGLG
jgi:4-aminobutyrate aminotransferase-like enzyme